MNRRSFIKSLAALAAALPFVKSVIPAAAAPTVPPIPTGVYETAHVFTYHNGGYTYVSVRWRVKLSDGTWSKWQNVEPPVSLGPTLTVSTAKVNASTWGTK